MNDSDDIQRTFDALRRAPYLEAVVAYTMAAFNVPTGSTEAEQKAACIAAIEELGWTDAELTEEGWRRERAGL